VKNYKNGSKNTFTVEDVYSWCHNCQFYHFIVDSLIAIISFLGFVRFVPHVTLNILTNHVSVNGENQVGDAGSGSFYKL
jgi:hypothetical protein